VIAEPAEQAVVEAAGESQAAPVEASASETETSAGEEAAPTVAAALNSEPEQSAGIPTGDGDTALQSSATASPVADEPVTTDEPLAATPSAPDQPSAEAGAGEMPAEEPKPILIWRPARFDQRPRHRHEARPRDGAARSGEVRKPGDRQVEARPADAPRPPREGDGAQRPSGKQRFERKFGGKPGGRRDGEQRDGKDAGPRKSGANGRQDGGPKGDRSGPDRNGPKSWTTQKPREDRPVRVDPDSPFAKLAALRDQLKK
jgi:ATP-dependent RNA helicase SUPV3L1/SUV3